MQLLSEKENRHIGRESWGSSEWLTVTATYLPIGNRWARYTPGMTVSEALVVSINNRARLPILCITRYYLRPARKPQ